MKHLVSVLFFFIGGFVAFGQNQPVFRQWFTVPGIYNPSLVSENKSTDLTLLHRRQWVTAGNGPLATGMFFQHSGRHRLDYGLSITGQEAVRLKSADTRLMMAYRVPLNSKTVLRFGMSLGVATRRLDVGTDDFSTDPAILNAAQRLFGASGSVGVALQKGAFQLSAALPAVVPQENYSLAQLAAIGNSQLLSQWYTARYRPKSKTGRLEGDLWTVYRVIRDQRRNWEAGGNILFNNSFSLGMSFNSALGVAVNMGIQFPGGLRVGYCWEPGFGAENSFGTSHEFQLAIRFLESGGSKR